jgi:uncharacterized radical SAM protein YgiQ
MPNVPLPRKGPELGQYLPTSRQELELRGWDEVDIVFVSGDAYVDHPSFAAAILGRVLEAKGFRVAILPQPDWRSADAWRELGRPRLFYAVSAGNMDSMVNHYTANRKKRNQDAYSPGGQIGMRPDRATGPYAQRCREAFKDVPIVAGGVEASLRRIAHYDYWSDKVRPSSLVSSKADLVAFGMGERTIVSIAEGLRDGKSIQELRSLRGVAYLLGKNEELPPHRWEDAACDNRTVELPSFEEVQEDPLAFARMTRLLHHETNPLNGRRLTQATAIGRSSSIRPTCRSRPKSSTSPTTSPTRAARIHATRMRRSRPSPRSRTRCRSCAAALAAAPSARSRCIRAARSRAAARTPSFASSRR